MLQLVGRVSDGGGGSDITHRVIEISRGGDLHPGVGADSGDGLPLLSLGQELLERTWTRWQLRRCVARGPDCRVLGNVWLHGRGEVRLGRGVVLDGRTTPIELHSSAGAKIVLGDYVRIEGGASLEAELSIQVGEGVVLGPYSKVIDNQFHPVRGERWRRPPSIEVVIEAYATVGARAIVLPGAHVGRRAVVGPGAVISKKVPAGATVSGVPGKVS